MTVVTKRLLSLLPLCVLFCSCNSRNPDWEETYPVVGEIFVDGSPAASLQVTCHSTEGLGTETGWTCKGMTDEEGKFEINTYEKGDGVPAGDYIVTFMWGETNFASMKYGGPDKLNKKYLDPKESEVKFTAVEGEPIDLGRIELTTKK